MLHVSAAALHPLLHDYGGFLPEVYNLTYSAEGYLWVATEVKAADEG